MEVETIRFAGMDEFIELCAENDTRYEYTVAWIDCMVQGKHLGRGLFISGNHAGPDVAPVILHGPGSASRWICRLPLINADRACVQQRPLSDAIQNPQMRVRTLRAVFFPAGRNSALEPALRPPWVPAIPVRDACGRGPKALREIINRAAQEGLIRFSACSKSSETVALPACFPFRDPG